MEGIQRFREILTTSATIVLGISRNINGRQCSLLEVNEITVVTIIILNSYEMLVTEYVKHT